jgi:hypothetical protein
MPILHEPVEILVAMEVTRYEEFPEDGSVHVHGYVGDYEISVCLPLEDKRAQRLRQQKNAQRRQRKG